MSAQETRAVVRRLFEVGNEKDADAYLELLHEDFVNHSAPPGMPNDREGYRQYFNMFVNAFPDYELTLEDMVVDGDTAATRWIGRGTHTGEFMEIPPTGRTGELEGITFYRVADGKVIEQRANLEMLGLLQQLGVISGPGE